MSVTRGSGSETYEPVMNVAGEAARLVSGPEVQRHVIDHAPPTGDADHIHENDVEDIFPFMGKFEDKVIAVNRLMVHFEGDADMDYAVAKLARNGINRDPRAPGEPGEGLNEYDTTAQFEFYTGASQLDAGGGDAGNSGDGHQFSEVWKANEPHNYLFHLQKDDTIVANTFSDLGDEGLSNAKWRLDYGIFEWLD